eukprot:TRINITY_DN7108_c0_g1_i1.p1 TRINITY_DN7108_c0_g1~~TRINITY_DN7108_c0_g1_i1.p1  ORF type:complete len:995 (-),score=257.85 TRINITY_DN7108_c0_g1_i1:255-3167(-)
MDFDQSPRRASPRGPAGATPSSSLRRLDFQPLSTPDPNEKLKNTLRKQLSRRSVVDESCDTDLFDNRSCENNSFHIELGKEVASNPLDLLDADKSIPRYAQQFFKRDHGNYVSEGNVKDGPAVLSFERVKDKTQQAWAVLRTKQHTKYYQTPAKQSTSYSSMLSYAKSKFPEIATHSFSQVKDSSALEPELLKYEAQSISNNFKFGVLYVKDGQKTEDDMFSNVGTSPAFDEFLSCLGQRIELKGWTRFRGGLDVKTDTTGTHSYFSGFGDLEIMYHVSTMLPFFPKDPQQVERKRHIGNDVVVVVFTESRDPFDPLVLTSHFNHVFVVVRPHWSSLLGRYRFRVGVATKPGVKKTGPHLPLPAVFEANAQFRDFFLTKLVNLERAAMRAPDFKGKMQRTRRQLLTELVKLANTKPTRAKPAAKLTPPSSSQQKRSPATSPSGTPAPAPSWDEEPAPAEIELSGALGMMIVARPLSARARTPPHSAPSFSTPPRKGSLPSHESVSLISSAKSVSPVAPLARKSSGANLRLFGLRKSSVDASTLAASPRSKFTSVMLSPPKNKSKPNRYSITEVDLLHATLNFPSTPRPSDPVSADDPMTPRRRAASSGQHALLGGDLAFRPTTAPSSTESAPPETAPAADVVRVNSIKYPNGDEYFGELNDDGEQHGHGRLVTVDTGDVYKGDFQHNQYHGHGTLVRRNGDRYEGTFLNDMFHGTGTCFYACGDSYEGSYKDGERHGFGVYRHAGGNVYEGQFRHGKIHARGKYTYSNGDRYEGNFKHGLYDGVGTLYYANGDTYAGTFKNGLRHGRGLYTYANSSGSMYDGQYFNGVREGYGVFVDENQDRYEGQFRGGRLEGHGRYTFFETGDLYVGDFKEDVFHGMGKYTGSSGSYDGQFQHGKRHGRGRLVMRNGNIYEGEFHMDAIDGTGVYTWLASGNRYEGQFHAGKPHGSGTLYADSKSVTGRFENGVIVST